MKVFTIDRDNRILAYTTGGDVPAEAGIHTFSSEAELATLIEFLSLRELADIWNSFAGLTPFDDIWPVSRFRDRRTAVARIWKAVQRLDAPKAANAEPRARDATPKGKGSR